MVQPHFFSQFHHLSPGLCVRGLRVAAIIMNFDKNALIPGRHNQYRSACKQLDHEFFLYGA